jgi:peptide/nickel transport system substrate-binding protein
VVVEPGLAGMPKVNADLTEWTFTLRDGAMFSDGTPVTANDVVKTLAVQWDAADPLHVGNTGAFDYWSGLFGGFMNPPAK